MSPSIVLSFHDVCPMPVSYVSSLSLLQYDLVLQQFSVQTISFNLIDYRVTRNPLSGEYWASSERVVTSLVPSSNLVDGL